MKKRGRKQASHFSIRRVLKVIGVFGMVLLLLMAAGYGLFVYYKPQIQAAINGVVRKEINGEIGIEKIGINFFRNFPTISITLKKVYLRDLEYERFQRDFFKAERIDLEVDTEKLLEKEINVTAIRIVNAETFIFRTKSGYSNLDIFRVSKPDSVKGKSSILVNFKNIDVQNMSVSYQDSLKQKQVNVQFISTENHVLKRDSSVFFHVSGDIKFDGLVLNPAKGSFLKNKPATADLHLELFPTQQRLEIGRSTLGLASSLVSLTGEFNFAQPKNYALVIESERIGYKEGVSVLSDSLQRKLGKYEIEKPVKVRVTLKGPLEESSKTSIDITYEVKNSKMVTEKFTGDHITLQGSFTNHVDPAKKYNDVNSKLTFDSLKGALFGIPFRASSTIQNLEDPYLTLHSVANFNLTEVNRVADKTRFNFTTGQVQSEIFFTGKLKDFDDPAKNRHGKLNGRYQIKKGGLQLVVEEITIDEMNAEVRFTQDRLDVDKFACRLNKNPIEMKGSLVGFLPFLQEPEKKGKLNMTLASPRLDFTKLIVKKKQGRAPSRTEKKKQLSDELDKIYAGLEFDFVFLVDEFLYKHFAGKKLRGNVKLAQDKLQANKMSFDFAAGRVIFNLTVDKIRAANSPFFIQASVINSGIKEFFYAFDNFNQNTIRHQNLQGKLSMDATFQGRLDQNVAIAPAYLLGRTTFRIRNGRLIDFQPLENMSHFLFKRRDFSNVQFAEIKGDLNVKGSEIDVSRMEIQSSVLSVFLEGRYSLKDNTDLSIQVPLSNLKRRDKNFKPQNVGTDAKVGLSVFLRAHSENGKTVISYDALKKNKKKKS